MRRGRQAKWREPRFWRLAERTWPDDARVLQRQHADASPSDYNNAATRMKARHEGFVAALEVASRPVVDRTAEAFDTLAANRRRAHVG